MNALPWSGFWERNRSMMALALAKSLTSRGSGNGSWLWNTLSRTLSFNMGCEPKCWITTASQLPSTKLFLDLSGFV